MERLISDSLVRRTSQTLLLCVLSFLVVIVGLVDGFAIAYQLGELDQWTGAATNVLGLLTLPFQSMFAQIVVVFGAAVPVLFGIVCFEIDRTVTPPKPSSNLNLTGRSAFLVMLSGIAVTVLGIALIRTIPDAVSSLSGGPANTERINGVLVGVLSFQAIYVAQLIGLKSK